MKIRRKMRLDKRRDDAAAQRQVNGVQKVAERRRRDARIMARVRSESLPYTPEVMSWLSVKLGKKASRITPEDVAQFTS